MSYAIKALYIKLRYISTTTACRSDDGKLVDNNEIGPLNTLTAPLINHNKSMLLAIVNGLDAEDNMDIWINYMPIEWKKQPLALQRTKAPFYLTQPADTPA